LTARGLGGRNPELPRRSDLFVRVCVLVESSLDEAPKALQHIPGGSGEAGGQNRSLPEQGESGWG